MNVGLTLNRSTRFFCRNEDSSYRQKQATIKLFAVNATDGVPVTQLRLDLAQHIGAQNFPKEAPFEGMPSLKAQLALTVIKEDHLLEELNLTLEILKQASIENIIHEEKEVI